MTAFKHKPNKLKYLTNVRTLDELHRDCMAKFNDRKNKLPDKKQQLAKLHTEMNSLQKINNADTLKQKAQLRLSIKTLENEISKSDNNNEILEYFSKTGNILLSYHNATTGFFYNIGSNQSTQEETDEINLDDIVINNKNDNIADENDTTGSLMISDKLKLLNKLSQENRKVKKPVKKRKINYSEKTVNKSILNFLPTDTKDVVETQAVVNRASLQEKFLMITDPAYACDKTKLSSAKYCPNCKCEMLLFQSEGSFICQQCGEVEYVIIESEIPSHKDALNEKPKYPYKKVNHLKEKLSQFQSRESADIPESIFDTIKKELKKQRIEHRDCTPKQIKKIIKNYRFTEYYEHLQQIYCKISGSPPVTLSRETEEKIICMFTDMQDSFRRHCPPDRSNFLNYSYVLNKIFRILKLKKHAKYFDLLKSRDKLRDQDVIWFKICKDMNWKYYSSFCNKGDA